MSIRPHGRTVQEGPTEQPFTCPYCWETVTMLIEPLEEAQTYVEDCEVCCNPIQITFAADGEDIRFSAEAIEQ